MTGFRRRIVLGLILVIALASVSGVYANWRTSTLSAPSPVTSSVTSYPLELRMELAKTEFGQGELISPKVYLKNISNRTVEVESIHGWFDFQFINENGTVVYDWRRDAGIVYVPVTKILWPDAEFSYTTQTSIVASKGSTALELPKGNYTILEFSMPLKVAYLEPYELLGEIAMKIQPVPIIIT